MLKYCIHKLHGGFIYELNIRYVIAMCVVIASHYLLQESMSSEWVLNETGLFLIGASIGIIINMFMPSNIQIIYIGQAKLQNEVSSILNLLSDTKFFLEHIEIVKSQRDILYNLYELTSRLSSVPKQAYVVSNFINKIGNTSFNAQTGESLLNELDSISKYMRNQPLPKDRDEFENRAILFLCLVELRKLLVNRINAQHLRDNNYYNDNF